MDSDWVHARFELDGTTYATETGWYGDLPDVGALVALETHREDLATARMPGSRAELYWGAGIATAAVASGAGALLLGRSARRARSAPVT